VAEYIHPTPPTPEDIATIKQMVEEIDAYTAPFRVIDGGRAQDQTRQAHDAKGHLTLAFGPDAAKAPADQSTVVRGLFHKGSITLLYGLPKSGKSFLATNAAMAVANPEIASWMGCRIQQHGPVLYVACEGHGGFWKRLQAAGHVPKTSPLPPGAQCLSAMTTGAVIVGCQTLPTC